MIQISTFQPDAHLTFAGSILQFYTSGLEIEDGKDVRHIIYANRSAAFSHLERLAVHTFYFSNKIPRQVLPGSRLTHPVAPRGSWDNALRDANMCVALRPHWARAYASRSPPPPFSRLQR